MKIIGENINGTRGQVKRAIAERDVGFIQKLAKDQAEAGAAWLDVNAGTSPEREPDDLIWLVRTIQEVVEIPLSLDSTNPIAILAAIKEVRQTPIINSISGEPTRLQELLPLVSEAGCGVIALAMSEKGIPATRDERMAVIRHVISETRREGIPDDRVYVDPLVMALATNTQSARIALDTMGSVRSEFPEVHLTSGLSNVSYGLPLRTLINQAFLTLAIEAGLDSAILNPLDRQLRRALLAAEVVLGRDRNCLTYIRAYRAGLLGHQET